MGETGRLEVMLRHRIGAVALDVAFTLNKPWTVLFAPSGAGKSTVLRVIAGLVRPDVGRVVWTGAAERSVVLADTERGIFVPPHRRSIRSVGQQAALFPHRTVLENVTYGMEARDTVNEILRLCRIEHLAGKMPGMLSGGERQRVALARAIAPSGGRVLLLDEPFSALDMGMREELIGGLQGWLGERRIPVLQVTHDVGEVFALGAEVIKMSGGSVAAQGSVGTVLGEEREWLVGQLVKEIPGIEERNARLVRKL